jgi:hypothetical protein
MVSLQVRRCGAKPNRITPIYLTKLRGEEIDERPHFADNAPRRYPGVDFV